MMSSLRLFSLPLFPDERLSSLLLRTITLFLVYCRRETIGTSSSSLSASSSSSLCPKPCFCNALSKIVYCSRRGVHAIPEGINLETLQLNLNGNAFHSASIGSTNISRYVNLEHLYLSECGIENIDVDTFVDLVNLKWLDLSNNRLKVLMQFTFRGLTLEHLFLNGNRNIQLLPGSFDGLVSTGLYLHDCSLKSLKTEVFDSLNDTIRNLWLNGNELEKLDKSFSPMFYNIQHLRLGSNPLHCGCEAVWLKEFYDKNGDVFKGASQPSCFAPSRLKGKYFNEMSLFDFRCQSPIFNNIDILFNDTIGKLRCSATGDPTPILFWIQPTGKTTKYAPPTDETSRKNEGVLILQTLPASNMVGMYICVANNEAGNVTLAVNVSWPGSKAVGGSISHLPLPPAPSTANGGFPPADMIGLSEWEISRHRHHLPASFVNGSSGLENGNSDDTVSLSVTAVQSVPPGPPPPPPLHASAAAEVNHRGQRLFSVAELVCAVVVTHLCTLLATLLFVAVFCYKRRARQKQQQQLLPSNDLYQRQPLHGLQLEKPSITYPSENYYRSTVDSHCVYPNSRDAVIHNAQRFRDK